ncbi:MAG: hypothetical protein J5943_05495, partial [Oribacterium sp.]|nr:hypothetical protein [Oribacterium sp.]
MKKSGIIKRHVKRKIAAVLLATMLLDQFPVTGYAEPLEWETQAEPAEQEQSAPEEAQPVTEEQTGAEEAQHVADEQAGAEEAKPVAEEQTGAEETAPAEVSEAGGEDIIVEVMGTQENVSYIDENGDDQNCNNYTVLTGSE